MIRCGEARQKGGRFARRSWPSARSTLPPLTPSSSSCNGAGLCHRGDAVDSCAGHEGSLIFAQQTVCDREASVVWLASTLDEAASEGASGRTSYPVEAVRQQLHVGGPGLGGPGTHVSLTAAPGCTQGRRDGEISGPVDRFHGGMHHVRSGLNIPAAPYRRRLSASRSKQAAQHDKQQLPKLDTTHN